MYKMYKILSCLELVKYPVLEFLNNLWGLGNRVGIVLSYRPPRLHSLTELVPYKESNHGFKNLVSGETRMRNWCGKNWLVKTHQSHQPDGSLTSSCSSPFWFPQLFTKSTEYLPTVRHHISRIQTGTDAATQWWILKRLCNETKHRITSVFLKKQTTCIKNYVTNIQFRPLGTTCQGLFSVNIKLRHVFFFPNIL